MLTFHQLKNDAKSRQNIICKVASSYQVNLAIERPVTKMKNGKNTFGSSKCKVTFGFEYIYLRL